MASGAFGLSPQAQIFLIGSGILYLIYASKKGLFPFNKGGPASTVTDLFSSSSGDNSGDSSSDFIPPSRGGFDARKNIDLGNGFQMPIPPGGTSSGNGYLPGQKGPTQPFVSTVANDPTPTDYGIYTQYLNGLRNEYQKMDERQRLAGTQQIGIGGDITTLPQPPGVGGIPYGTNGVRPPYMGPYMGPLPFRPPSPMRRMPPPYYQQQRRYGYPPPSSGDIPPGLLYSSSTDDNSSNDNGFSINAPGVHIGMDGINVGVPSQYDLNRLENLGSSSGTNNNFQQMVQDKINSQIHNLSNSDLGPSSMGDSSISSGDSSMSDGNSSDNSSSGDTSSSGGDNSGGGSDTSSMDSSGGDSGGGSSGGGRHHHSSKHHKKKHHSKKKHHHRSRFATFVNYDEGPAPVPVDLNRINPTLFNMVSRNQPGGMIGYKLGNY